MDDSQQSMSCSIRLILAPQAGLQVNIEPRNDYDYDDDDDIFIGSVVEISLKERTRTYAGKATRNVIVSREFSNQ